MWRILVSLAPYLCENQQHHYQNSSANATALGQLQSLVQQVQNTSDTRTTPARVGDRVTHQPKELLVHTAPWFKKPTAWMLRWWKICGNQFSRLYDKCAIGTNVTLRTILSTVKTIRLPSITPYRPLTQGQTNATYEFRLKKSSKSTYLLNNFNTYIVISLKDWTYQITDIPGLIRPEVFKYYGSFQCLQDLEISSFQFWDSSWYV